jgi:acetyl-CoA synthetase
MGFEGLREQTVAAPRSWADARARHQWRIPPDYNIAADCIDRHQELRDKPALYYEDDRGRREVYSFGRMDELSRRFANALRGLGIKPGDVVALHLPQMPETALAHLALYRLGAIALPISRLFAADGLRYRLKHSEARAILVEPENLAKVESVRAELPALRHVIAAGPAQAGALSFDDLVARASDQFTMERGSVENPCVLLYTSGTAGEPKGVVHGSRFVAGYNGNDYAHNFFGPGDLYYSPADWAWIGGLLVGLLGVWPHGVPVLAYKSSGRFDPELMLRLMDRYGVTLSLQTPTVIKQLREVVAHPRQKFPGLKLRCVSCGSEPVSPELVRWMKDEVGSAFNQLYGQTEAMGFIGDCSAIEEPKLGPMGKAYPGHQVAVVSDEGVELPPGEVGQLAISRDDPVVTKGFWKNPEAMAERTIGRWFVTGDLVYCDDQGYLYYKGRADDVIKTSGYRVGPGEVEAKLIEHPAVAICAVVGVPEERRGEAIKAFIKLRTGVEPSSGLAEEIRRFVKTRLAAHESPHEIEFVSELPMTLTGKIKRKELRQREIERRSAPAKPEVGTSSKP